MGLVVDSAATDDQAGALQRILSGQEGGAFGQLSQFFGEFVGMQRAAVSISDGEKPWASVEGLSRAEFEALRGADGNPTTVKNAMFGFVPEFTVGKATGRSDAFGLAFDASYGEQADYVFSSEEAREAAVRGRI